MPLKSSINPRIIDITGQVFGQLTVIAIADGMGVGRAYWDCLCTCGTRTTVSGKHLRNGHTRSCGCLSRATVAARSKTHGLTGSSEFHIWHQMRQRCDNPNATGYKDYGGRGITVCDRWNHSLENFIADMGPRPGKQYSIDRIDNESGYSPENCRWATRRQQNNNTKRNLPPITHEGETHTLVEWAVILGVSKEGLRRWIARKNASIQDFIQWRREHGRPVGRL